MRRVLVFATGLALAACGDDPAPVSIPPLPELTLLAPGSPTGPGECVRRGQDPEQSITARIELRHFTLRPPLTCTERECGTVRFTIRRSGNELLTFESAQRFTSIPTLELPDGRYTIEAALYDTFGDPFESKAEEEPKCTTCERWFELDGTCGEVEPEPAPPPSDDAGTPPVEPPDAGPPATPDAGSEPDADGGRVTDGGSTPDTDGGRVTDAGGNPPDADAPDVGPTGDAQAR